MKIRRLLSLILVMLMTVTLFCACTGTDDLQRQIDEWKEKAELQDKRIAELEEEIEIRDGKIAGLETDVAGLEEDVASRDSRIKELENELKARNGKITELEEKIAANVARIAQLEKELQESNGKVAELEEEIAANVARIAELKKELQESNDMIAELEKELAQFRTPGLVYSLIADGAEYEVTDYTGTSAKVIIPATYNNKPVTEIGESAFCYNKTITHVVIPDSVKKIKVAAFYDSTVQRITFAGVSRLEVIEEAAFLTRSLRSFWIPLSVKHIESDAFFVAGDFISVPDDEFSVMLYAEAESQPEGWLPQG